MNFVTREEFEVVKKIAQDNRAMIEKLQKSQKPLAKKATKTSIDKGSKTIKK